MSVLAPPTRNSDPPRGNSPTKPGISARLERVLDLVGAGLPYTEVLNLSEMLVGPFESHVRTLVKAGKVERWYAPQNGYAANPEWLLPGPHHSDISDPSFVRLVKDVQATHGLSQASNEKPKTKVAPQHARIVMLEDIELAARLGTAADPARILDRLELNDVGLGRRFAEAHRGELIYTQEWGWLVWDKRRYVRDKTLEVEKRAELTVRNMLAEALVIDDKQDREKIIAFALKCHSSSKVDAMIRMGRKFLARTIEEFDRDPLLLNVENGTIDQRTKELREHRREDLITKLSPVKYDPDAKAPTFAAFLNQTLDGSDELIRFVQRGIGLAATGLTDRVFFMLYGPGGNGKSTLMNAVKDTLGEYARRTTVDTILVKRGNQSLGPELAQLAGVRFVWTAEAEQNETLAAARINDLTGGEPVVANFKFHDSFEFTPEFTIFFSTNHRPTVNVRTQGFWDRMNEIPFTVRIPEDKQDKNLKHKHREELPGILAWIVEGTYDYLNNGLGRPPEVVAATNNYRADMDQITRFINETLERDPSGEIAANAVWDTYKFWADNGLVKPPLNKQQFKGALEEDGFTQHRRNRGLFWKGLRVKTPLDQTDDTNQADPMYQPQDAEKEWA